MYSLFTHGDPQFLAILNPVCCPLTMFDFGRFKDHGSFQLMGNGLHLCPQIDCSVVTFEHVY